MLHQHPHLMHRQGPQAPPRAAFSGTRGGSFSTLILIPRGWTCWRATSLHFTSLAARTTTLLPPSPPIFTLVPTSIVHVGGR